MKHYGNQYLDPRFLRNVVPLIVRRSIGCERKGVKIMKKAMVIVVVVLSSLSFSTRSFAQMLKGPRTHNAAKTETVSGKIVSIDQEKSQVVIKNAGGTDKTVAVSPKELASLKAGDEAVAVLPLGSNKAQTIKKMAVKKAY